jgi:hypothetical protein
MKNLFILSLMLLISSHSNAENLIKLYSKKNAKLKGSYEAFLDMDSVKEVGSGIYEIITVENLPPLMENEGDIIENPHRSEKMYLNINCSTNKARRKIIDNYFKLNGQGLFERTDLEASYPNSKGFVMSPKTIEKLSANIICKK